MMEIGVPTTSTDIYRFLKYRFFEGEFHGKLLLRIKTQRNCLISYQQPLGITIVCSKVHHVKNHSN